MSLTRRNVLRGLGGVALGLPLLQGFKPAGPEAWDGGTIYDPEGGKIYKSKFRLKGADSLEVDGCVLFFCQSQTWTRYRG